MDGVVLLHGIARRSSSMRRMERALAAAGYSVLNVDYPARQQGLSDLAQWIHPQVTGFSRALDGQIHFVTHSMGGLLARTYVTRFRPSRLGRVVMLAPPNGGSEVADLLSGGWAYGRYFGPAGQELVTQRTQVMNETLGFVDYPVGIIAGDRSADPLSSVFILPRPNDGKVTVASTHVEGETDHITLHTTHTLMMFNPEVIQQTATFLRTGRFTR